MRVFGIDFVLGGVPGTQVVLVDDHDGKPKIRLSMLLESFDGDWMPQMECLAPILRAFPSAVVAIAEGQDAIIPVLKKCSPQTTYRLISERPLVLRDSSAHVSFEQPTTALLLACAAAGWS